MGIKLLPQGNKRISAFLEAFSSLFIGNQTASPNKDHRKIINKIFQFPLHWESNCFVKRFHEYHCRYFLSVPSSLGIKLLRSYTDHLVRAHRTFSSLFIGNQTASFTEDNSIVMRLTFQFPLHWESNCFISATDSRLISAPLSVPSSLGIKLLHSKILELLKEHYAFSSLFIGNQTASCSITLTKSVFTFFQFPLHWESNCFPSMLPYP